MAIYNVFVEETKDFKLNGLNKQIYDLVVKYTNGKCKIQYNTEKTKSFLDLETNQLHTFNGRKYIFSHMFNENELKSFKPAYGSISPEELLEFMLTYFKVSREDMETKFKKREKILEEIKKLEEELDAIKL